MAKKKGNTDIDFRVEISPKLQRYLQRNLPDRLQDARKNAVEAAGMVWADETKEITRNEGHVDTSLYVNSIGYQTGNPAEPLYNLDHGESKTQLEIGADVAYAAALEKRYALMARGLDVAQSRMKRVAETQVKKAIFR